MATHVGLEYSILDGDLLYVLQNGSLLRVNENFTEYDVFDDYCLDMDSDEGMLTAVVCFEKIDTVIFRGEAFIYSTCMLISVPCLLVTAFLYLRIEEFCDLHGKSLALHSLCLAAAFIFQTVVQIRSNITPMLSYLIQYFMLACFFWLTAMCVDICIQVW